MQDFNDALCSYYARHCVHPPRCPARSLAALKKLLPSQQGESCHDSDQNCLSWARSGECERNTGFMTANCRQSCGKCDHVVLLGTPANCADAAECGGAREAGRCEADVALMQEECAATCGFCSKAVEADTPAERRSFDHQCPDGTDLGGGDNSSPSLLHPPPPPPSPLASPPSPSSTAAARVSPAPAPVLARSAARPVEQPPRGVEARGMEWPRPVPHPSRKEAAPPGDMPAQAARRMPPRPRELYAAEPSVATDGLLLAWPFFLVAAIALVGLGWVLRGASDRRRKLRLAGGVTSSRRVPPV
mmetsp:Transcript_2994/g.9098  ORF Transcript_2994/g.9098 Transcript_2994/m.9098 type:complete len:303 (-) Transcript_2994:68-976(-)